MHRVCVVTLSTLALAMFACLSGMELIMSSSRAASSEEQVIRALAAQEFGWADKDMDVQAMPDPAPSAGCRFFSVDNTASGEPGYAYAVLPDGTVLGTNDPNRAVKILAACGTGNTDANWWASVVSRFAWSAAGGVLVDEHDTLAIQYLRANGLDYHPTLTRDPDDNLLLTFYKNDHQRSHIDRLHARWTPDHQLTVSRKEIR